MQIWHGGTALALKEASLEALLERYQQADAPATTELIRRLSPDLLRFFLAQQATRKLCRRPRLRSSCLIRYRAATDLLVVRFGIELPSVVSALARLNLFREPEFLGRLGRSTNFAKRCPERVVSLDVIRI